jgi:hypothetical protein
MTSQKKAQQEIALQMLELLRNFNLDFNLRIGQIYDNDANMAGKKFLQYIVTE